MKKRKKYVWILEVDFDNGKGFEPTVWCSLTYADAKKQMAECRGDTQAKFRIKRYSRGK